MLSCLNMDPKWQIFQKGFILQTISVNGVLFKLFPVWCYFLRKSHANRRRHWRVRTGGDMWHWSRQYHQRFELHETRQLDWRVEQAGNCQLYWRLLASCAADWECFIMSLIKEFEEYIHGIFFNELCF